GRPAGPHLTDADPATRWGFSDRFGPRPQRAWLVSSSVGAEPRARQGQRETIERRVLEERDQAAGLIRR
ncbi:MAG: hypothetical protein ABW219_14625, partial [Ilumatobacteraceae bacterium]